MNVENFTQINLRIITQEKEHLRKRELFCPVEAKNTVMKAFETEVYIK